MQHAVSTWRTFCLLKYTNPLISYRIGWEDSSYCYFFSTLINLDVRGATLICRKLMKYTKRILNQIEKKPVCICRIMMFSSGSANGPKDVSLCLYMFELSSSFALGERRGKLMAGVFDRSVCKTSPRRSCALVSCLAQSHRSTVCTEIFILNVYVLFFLYNFNLSIHKYI